MPTPALLTRMSTLPNSLMARDDRVAVAGIADVGPDGDRAPAFGFDKLAGVRQSSRRTASTRSAPAWASAWANPTPRPLEAPVTIATRPSGRNWSRGGRFGVRSGSQQSDHQVPVMVVVVRIVTLGQPRRA